MRPLAKVFAGSILLVAAGAQAGDFRSDMDTIDTASRRNDVAELQRLDDELAAIPTDYRHAYLGYSLSIAQQTHGQHDAAEESLERTADLLRGIVEADPESAEAWALLSSVYGLQIGYSPFKGPFLGPRASRALSQAMRLEPDNPRVVMMKGISLYNTPRMFGGDRRASITWFTKAIERFTADPGQEIRWGHADAYIWRALAHYHYEDTGLALADLDAALSIAPDDAWAQHLRSQVTRRTTGNQADSVTSRDRAAEHTNG